MRIAIGGIEHESSNYSPVKTPLEAFCGHSRSSGTDELLQRSGEVNTIVDGFIKELRRQDVERVPLIWRHAPSGGQPTRETHQGPEGISAGAAASGESGGWGPLEPAWSLLRPRH